jgi:hypothetical protein
MRKNKSEYANDIKIMMNLIKRNEEKMIKIRKTKLKDLWDELFRTLIHMKLDDEIVKRINL